MEQEKRLTGRVALVTASTRGIGLASAEALAGAGATVYLAARNRERAEEAITRIAENGGKARYVHYDAQEPASCGIMVETAARTEGRLDILVNNYGGTDVRLDRDVEHSDPDDFSRIVWNNLQSVFLPCKYALPYLRRSGGGSIVNISTIGSVVPDLSRTAYCVSKGAVNPLTQNLAVQGARWNIRCNAVLPGLIGTQAALDNMPEAFRRSFLRHVPLGRVGTPEEVAAAVLFLAGDGASFITGTLLEVAGGFGLPTPQYAEFADALCAADEKVAEAERAAPCHEENTAGSSLEEEPLPAEEETLPAEEEPSPVKGRK